MARHSETLRLKWALAISVLYFFAELIAGFLTNSLALLSDAGHMLSDVGAMALSLFAFRMAQRPATHHSTFGFHRVEHIFVRLGLWDDSIRSNEDSAATARAHVAKTDPGASSFDELHALDYLAYAFLQQGRDEKTGEIAGQIRAVKRLDNAQFAAAYALAAVPARYALERGRWADAAALEVAPAWFPWSKFPFAEAITHVARAIGAARTGDIPRAREAVTRLGALREATIAAKIGYWPDQIEIQRREAAAWLAMAEGRKDEAVEVMASAVALEESTDKHPVTPGAVLPARELQGDLLMALGRPAEALAAYEASLAVAPNRSYALAAAVRAADGAGRRDAARAHFATLEKVAARADGSRTEFEKVKAIAKGGKESRQ
jgi:hypothetical protein